MKTVYLCGGINGMSDADAKDWRAFASESLADKFRLLDPMRRDYRGAEDANVAAIVAGDLKDIDASDIVLANCPRPSWGTAMEVFYAAHWHLTRGPQLYHCPPKAVVVVAPGGPVSPWLRQHATHLCRSLADACSLIREVWGR